MKRNITTCALTALTIASAFAAPVGREEALATARAFCADHGKPASLTLHSQKLNKIKAPADISGRQPFYIFNIGDRDGYIVVAGDDRAGDILAWSDTGSLTDTDLPPVCRLWLEQYAAEISSLPADEIPAEATSFTYPTTVVAPLVKSRWGQNAPYNNDCPVDSKTGKQCVTGCVATATAQVMYTYQWPPQATGTIDYFDAAQQQQRTLDLSTYPAFGWKEMTPVYDATSTEAQRSAVASLMKAVGYGCEMRYSSDTSIAYHRLAGSALIKYFGYDPDLHFYERRLTGDAEWIRILVEELAAGRPLIYDGKNPDMGHTFVCDGYDGNGMFHFNWGWNGMSDGYFRLSALNPEEQSTGGSAAGYTHSQSVICHISPAGTLPPDPQRAWLLAIDKLYFRDASAYHDAAVTAELTAPLSQAQLFFYCHNRGYNLFNGEVWAVATDNGGFTPLVKAEAADVAGGTYAPFSFPLSDANLQEGDHTIAFYYRWPDSDQWYRIGNTPTLPSECYVTVKGSEVTMRPLLTDTSLALAGEFQPGEMYEGFSKTWMLELQSTGDAHAEGYAGVAVIDDKGDYRALYTAATLVATGETAEVDVTGSLRDIPAGDYFFQPFFAQQPNPQPVDIRKLGAPVKGSIAAAPSLVITPAASAFFTMAADAETLEFNASNMQAKPWEGTLYAVITATDGTPYPGVMKSGMKIAGNANDTFTLHGDGMQPEPGTRMIKFCLNADGDFVIASLPIIITAKVGVDSPESDDSLSVVVNGSELTITTSYVIAQCSLYDTAGHTLAALSPRDTGAVIPTDGLAPGIYILAVISDNGDKAVRKISIR